MAAAGHRPLSWTAASGNDVSLCGVGARTPIGFTAASSAAAVRGSISGVELHPVFTDRNGDPVSMAIDAGLDVATPVAERMRHMLMSAVTQALAPLHERQETVRVPCIIGLTESRPGRPADLASTLATAAAEASGSPVHAVHILERGHAAGLMAIQLAAQRIADATTDVCMAAAVDSYHDREMLSWLDESGRLMSALNRSGFPPGEAAGACLLATEAAVERYGLPKLGKVRAAATALEERSILGTEVCVGIGLSAVIADVTSRLRLPHEAVTATYCDLNGQRYRSEEFMYALLRTQETFVDAHDYLCPADCWGDIGAASGPLYAALAVIASERGYAKGAFPLMWAGSESGHRTAVLLQTPWA